MPKIAKYIVIAIAALLGLLLIAIGIIAATFNPNDYKPLIIRLVQEKKQRTLAIPGEIKLRFFPRLGADLGRVSISEHNGSAEFAALDSAKVSLALFPLLARQLVVDHVKIDGMRANIRRNKDGSTNVDDLLSKDESGRQIRFDIDSVAISNAHVVFDDRKQARKLELDKLSLETGRLADGVPSKLQLTADIKSDKPALNARLAAASGFTLNLARKQYVLKGVDAQLKGSLFDLADLDLKLAGDADLQPESKRFALDGIKFAATGKRAGHPVEVKLDIPKLAATDKLVSGGKLNGEAKLADGASTITLNISAPSFEGSPQAFKVPALALEAGLKDPKRDVKARISGALTGDIGKLSFVSPQLALTLSGKQEGSVLEGALSTPLSANLGAQLVELPDIHAHFALPNPAGGKLNLKAAGSARVDLGKQTLAAAFKGGLDDSAFDARFGLTRFSPAAYSFDIGIDRLDLDRYQSKPSTAAVTQAAAEEKPIDLSALRELRADGSMRIGALKVKNIRTSNVRIDLHAAGGKLDISPLTANLYGGSMTGALSATANNYFAVRQKLAGINVGALLKDALDKDPIDGKGNVQLDVNASGATAMQIRKALNGSARLELRDGAVRGINIAQAVRSAKAKLGELRGDATSGQAQAGTGSAAEKTDFSELSGSFRIANGIAHNDDLNIKSPLLRIAGSGDIDLGAERLDYLVRTTVVQTLQGQGGPELQALKGVTVPVRLSGPLAAIGWRIDFAGLASELARQRIDEKKEEVKSRAQKTLEEEKAKLQEELKNQLKGLFGK